MSTEHLDAGFAQTRHAVEHERVGRRARQAHRVFLLSTSRTVRAVKVLAKVLEWESIPPFILFSLVRLPARTKSGVTW